MHCFYSAAYVITVWYVPLRNFLVLCELTVAFYTNYIVMCYMLGLLNCDLLYVKVSNGTWIYIAP